MGKLKLAGLWATALLSVTVGGASALGETPPAGDVGIKTVSYSGSGCRPGSVAYSIAGDRQAFTLLYSDYTVETRTRQGRPARKHCDIELELTAPEGWAFTVFGVTARAYASLEPGAFGFLRVWSGFGGRRGNIGRVRLAGPYDGDFQQSTDLPLSELEWSRCGRGAGERRVKLRTEIQVRTKGFADHQGDRDEPGLGNNLPRGMIALDAIDGAVAHRYGLAWKRCQGGGHGDGHGGGPRPGRPGHGRS